MKNVLLIDDEPWVLLGLQRTFNWEKYGFYVTAAVSSPMEGLSILQSQEIDVIFSDIRMPDMTGLELLKKAKALNPSIFFILVSGFADFQYAREALRYGAYDYLLKPIDETQTDAFLERLSNDLWDFYIQKNQALYESLLQEEIAIPVFFTNPQYPFYQAFHLRCTSMINKIPEPDFAQFKCLELDCHQSIYLCNTAKDLHDYLLWNIQPDACLGLSQILPLPLDHNLPRQALSAFRHSFFVGEPGLFTYHPTDSQLVQSVSTQIHSNCHSGRTIELADYLASLPIQKLTTDDVVFLWNQLQICLPDQPLPQKDFYYADFSQLQQDFQNWDTLISAIKDLCTTRIQPHLSSSGNDIFQQMVTYIEEHYTENLYLKDLSEHFYLSFTYCCDLFRKHMGTTFSKYLTELRMKKAAELLRDSSATIEDISFQCGYNDYSYFNKVFKKQYSCTPSQYRKENLK